MAVVSKNFNSENIFNVAIIPYVIDGENGSIAHKTKSTNVIFIGEGKW